MNREEIIEELKKRIGKMKGEDVLFLLSVISPLEETVECSE